MNSFKLASRSLAEKVGSVGSVVEFDERPWT